MATPIHTLIYNKTTEKWVNNKFIQLALDNTYNNPDFNMQLNIGDRIQIDGGYGGFTDDLVVEVFKRTHYYSKKTGYQLWLYLNIVQ